MQKIKKIVMWEVLPALPLNNILMPINLGIGFFYSPFSVDSVGTHLAIVVGLAEFGLA